MPWTNIASFNSGDVLTASKMNQVRGNVNIGHVVCTSSTRPASPDTGTMIYETDTAKLLVWNGSAWVDVLPQQPTGALIAFAGSAAPTGWLLCDGSAVNRTTYATLFTTLSTTYGAGDGSTTFNLPDMRGRMPMGAGTGTGLNASGTGAPTGTPQTARARGEWGGEETHLNTAAESGMPAHFHTFDRGEWSASAAAGSAAGAWAATKYTTQNTSTASAVNATNRHNTVPPYVVTNFIIKT